MGMKQKRCPRCKKLRRFVEGGDVYERRERSQRWTKVNGRWVCFMCEPVEPARVPEGGNSTVGMETSRDPEGAQKRVHQCKSCPWKVNCDPVTDIPGYVPELARKLDCTIATDPMESATPVLAGGTMHMMACHYSKPGEEFACAGWLENQLGVGNNLGLRLLMVKGRLPVPVTEGEQHQRYEDTLPCDQED